MTYQSTDNNNFFPKFPIKKDSQRDGNTKRRRGEGDWENTNLSSSPQEQVTKLSKNKYLLQQTIIDEKFNFYEKYVNKFSIDKKNYWKDVIETLEKNNVSRVFSRNARNFFGDSFTVKYTLPVISEYIITDKRTTKKYDDIFVFNNQKLNKNHLYYSTDGENFSLYFENFKNTRTENFVKASFRSFGEKLTGFQICNLNTDENRCVLCGEKFQIKENNTLEKWNGKIQYVDFDFKKDTKITHIFTKGRRHRIYNLQTKHGILNFVTEKEKHFVDKYSIFYRENSSKSWVSIGEFSGNFDRTTIISHEFPDEINCRYIRLVPLSFSNSPSIQVGFWNSKVKNCPQEKNIVYSLSLKSERKYYSKNAGWRRDSWTVVNPEHQKKRVLFRTEMKKYQFPQQDFIDGPEEPFEEFE